MGHITERLTCTFLTQESVISVSHGVWQGSMKCILGNSGLDWRLTNFFCKGPGSKYFRLCGS